MKRFIFCFFTLLQIHLMSQAEYNNLWEQVNDFQDKSQPKSALATCEKIYQAASKDNNEDQLIKAIVYMMRFTSEVDENARVKIINQLQDEIAKTKAPVKNVLQIFLARNIWAYYHQNSWQIRNRTNLEADTSKDIETWSLDKLETETRHTFWDALHDKKEILQAYDCPKFPMTIYQQANGERLRPTLYDVLVHESLDNFYLEETQLPRPTFQFLLDQASHFAIGLDFIEENAKSLDTSSHFFVALKLYRELMAFHKQKGNLDALADLELAKLNFVFGHSIVPDKEKIRFNSLISLKAAYVQTETFPAFCHLLALKFRDEGNMPKALELAEEGSKYKTKNVYTEDCKQLIYDIKATNMQVATEYIIPEQSTTKALVTYRNTDKLFLRVYASSFTEIHDKFNEFKKTHKHNLDFKKLYTAYLSKSKTPLHKKEYSLPTTINYQSQSTEILLPPLANGIYYFVFATEASFDATQALVSGEVVQVSQQALTYHKSEDTKYYHLNPVNRVTGEAIKGGKMKLYTFEEKYYDNYSYSQTLLKTYKELLPEADGQFKIDNTKGDYTSIMIEYLTDDQHKFYSTIENSSYNQNLYLWFDNHYYGQRPEDFSKEVESYRTQIYTDRAIYRPGQELYFKGFAFWAAQDRAQNRPVVKQNIKVSLIDANDQVVEEKKLTTNDFGSYNGVFHIPTGLMNGVFTITDGLTSENIQVEEYVRPKFVVALKKPEKSYVLQDTVHIQGTATAYNTSSISKAKVRYEVKRKPRYPRWCYGYWYGYFPNTDKEMVMTFGEVTTNESGAFEIAFQALPDMTIDAKFQPIFDYEVTAHVTDLNGETQSGNVYVSVAYQHYLLDITGIGNWEMGKEPTIGFTLTNQNGIPQKGKIQLKVEKFQIPQEVYRSQTWEVASHPSITEIEYHKLFPRDPYRKAPIKEDYKLDKEILNLSVAPSDSLDLKKLMGKTTPGLYKFTAITSDPTGKEVQAQYWVEVNHFDADRPIAPVHLSITSQQTEYKPGEVAKFKIVSSLSKLKILMEAFGPKGLLEKKWITMDKPVEFIKLTLPASNDPMGIEIHLTALQENRSYGANISLSIYPPSNEKPKKLQIKVESFRSSILPGAQEQFSIRIKGENTPDASEVLAWMYDASLDAILPFHVSTLSTEFFQRYLYPRSWSREIMGLQGFINHPFYTEKYNTKEYLYINYPQINWFGYSFGFRNRYRTLMKSSVSRDMALESYKESEDNAIMPSAAQVIEGSNGNTAIERKATVESDNQNVPGMPVANASTTSEKPQVQVRKNLKETAFFYPQLYTNADGEVKVSFTSPEALTRWKLYVLAHNKEMVSQVSLLETVTKKELMLTSNMPRFFRVTDKMTLSFKISNTTNTALKGMARLVLKDANTLKEINAAFEHQTISKSFEVGALANTEVSWQVSVPEDFDAVVWTVTAETETHSDGEEAIVPILKIKDLVIASQPLYVRGGETKKFVFAHMKEQSSKTLRNHKLTAEFTTQPAWYAVQALPYLIESPDECNNALTDRYYANALAMHIANSDPRIRQVFDTWKNIQPDALRSNLEKNQDLKYLALQETPWVMAGNDESADKRNLGLLLDENTMRQNLNDAITKLNRNQLSNGAWSWMDKDERYPDRYITQYLLTSLARLMALKALPASQDEMFKTMIIRGVEYLDNELEMDYVNWRKNKYINEDYFLNANHVAYFYMRQLLQSHMELPEPPAHYKLFMDKMELHAFKANIYLKAYIAMVLLRADRKSKTNDLIRSIKEHFIKSDEFGLYFKESYENNWYARPVETQCAVIELFDRLLQDKATADELKIWLLKQKQTHHWETSPATAEAVYAIIGTGTDFLSLDDKVTLKLGQKEQISTGDVGIKTEAGTGYVRKDFNASQISKDMANIEISKKGSAIAWGAVTWQYFEDIDKVKPNKAGIAVLKEYYLVQKTATGDQLKVISDSKSILVGDEVVVRLVIKTDRSYSYVLLKDHRPAGTEPTTQISGYETQDGLWYYQSMKDASSQFFISYLDKGTHVFEYRIRATRKGDFAAGYAAMQCMYAPEFNGHSQGLRMVIK